MKVVLTLLARDEADIVDWQLRYHYARGVDLVVATDHRSVDGTAEILERFADEGRLHYIRDESEMISQAETMTKMARIAATEHGADWVIPSDADEFWWPRRETFHEILAAVPAQVGVIRGFIRTFAPRPDDDRPFYERMTAVSRPVHDLESIYQASVHVVHRAHPAIDVNRGFHDAYADGLGRLIRDWCPLEVLHFPNRSPAQVARKYAQGFNAWIGAERGGGHVQAAYRQLENAGAEELWAGRVVDDEALEEGLRDGAFAVDTRLRDALKALDRNETPFPRPPTQDEDARFHYELGSMALRDAAAGVLRQTNAIQRRLSSIETGRS